MSKPAITRDAAAAIILEIKRAEERFLRLIDDLEDINGIDQHWLDMGVEKIELGVMALIRSVSSPDRISLPEDSE
jgi:hypothetical protein